MHSDRLWWRTTATSPNNQQWTAVCPAGHYGGILRSNPPVVLIPNWTPLDLTTGQTTRRGNRVHSTGRLRIASKISCNNNSLENSEPPNTPICLCGVFTRVQRPTGHLIHPEHRPKRPLTRVDTSCLLVELTPPAYGFKQLGIILQCISRQPGYEYIR